MHILHVIDGLGLGGAERMLVDIANASVADGHRVSVCITRNATTLVPELDSQIDVLVLNRTRQFTPAATHRLAQWQSARHCDVLHVHLRSSVTFMLLVRALEGLRKPIVFHDHYGTIEIDRHIPLWFRAGHRFVDQYVGVYDRLREWAHEAGMPPSRTRTIGNAIDLRRLVSRHSVDLRGELGLDADTTVAVVVATLRRDKGLEMLIEALDRCESRGRLHVAVAGAEQDATYAAECRARITERDLSTSITLLGGRTDVPALLAGADFAALSSHTESGPLVLLEYVAAGLPVVSTLVGEIGHRLAGEGLPGFVSPRDVSAFTRELDVLARMSRDERRERAAVGTRILNDSWDVRAVIPRWYEVYRAATGAT